MFADQNLGFKRKFDESMGIIKRYDEVISLKANKHSLSEMKAEIETKMEKDFQRKYKSCMESLMVKIQEDG